jgi:hypothetical protein
VRRCMEAAAIEARGLPGWRSLCQVGCACCVQQEEGGAGGAAATVTRLEAKRVADDQRAPSSSELQACSSRKSPGRLRIEKPILGSVHRPSLLSYTPSEFFVPSILSVVALNTAQWAARSAHNASQIVATLCGIIVLYLRETKAATIATIIAHTLTSVMPTHLEAQALCLPTPQ